jgi:hypothetical protein
MDIEKRALRKRSQDSFVNRCKIVKSLSNNGTRGDAAGKSARRTDDSIVLLASHNSPDVTAGTEHTSATYL